MRSRNDSSSRMCLSKTAECNFYSVKKSEKKSPEKEKTPDERSDAKTGTWTQKTSEEAKK